MTRGDGFAAGNRRLDGGYILVPVVVMLALVLAAVYATTLEGSVGMESTSRAREARQALLVAQSGLEHALYEANHSNCTNYSLATTPFGAHRYSASFTPTSSSPVSISATATLASGVTRTVIRESAPVYESTLSELFLQPGAEGKDAKLAASNPGTNYGAAAHLGIEPVGVAHGLLEFDLTGLPASAIVRSATLELYVSNGFETTVRVHRVTRGWEEGSCTGPGSCAADGATWNRLDGSTDWTTTGGDYDPIVAASAGYSYGTPWLVFDVSALVSAWHEGVPNHGMLLYTTSQWIDLAGSDHATANQRPKLTIEYTCECDPNPTPFFAVLQPGAGNGQDALIRDGSASDRNYGSHVDLVVGGSNSNQALVRFDLSGLPSNAIVSDAQLSMYVDGFDFLPFGGVSVHRTTSDWTEGSGGSAGLVPADGVNWSTADGVTAWLASGGDFDPAPLDDVSILSGLPGWYAWDVTSAVSDWKRGLQPNYGLMLTESWGSLYNARIISSDDPNGPRRPKLTVTYYCPCGAACSTPSIVGRDLLMVVVDPNGLTPQETNKRALFESWGFTISLIDESASESDYEVALVANDVVFVSEDVTSSQVSDRLSASPIGVVTEEDNLSDELGLAQSIVWTSGRDLTIEDNSHYITAHFGLGDLRIFSSNQSLAYVTGSLSADLRVLADAQGNPALIALEQGDERWDELASLDSRRVQLPWGGDAFEVASLNSDGLSIMRRALEWAATPPSPPAGYLDRFGARVCDPAIDHSRSHGSLDWSGTPWIESEGDNYCSGNIMLAEEDFSYRLRMTGVQEITRSVDLSGFAFATLRFRYKAAGGLSPTNYVAAETSDDGGVSWTELARIEADTGGSDAILSLGITTAMTADSRIRFRSFNLNATREVFLDDVAVVEEETVAPFVCSIHYRDFVTDNVYSGDDGSLNWSSDWLEINESDGPNAGDEQAASFDGGYVLTVRDNDGGGEGLEREADLSSTTTATLKFLYRRSGFDNANDYVTIGVSSDGGVNWTELDAIGGGGSDPQFVEASYSLDAHLSVTTRIRFLTSPDLGGSDILLIDDVEICLEAVP